MKLHLYHHPPASFWKEFATWQQEIRQKQNLSGPSVNWQFVVAVYIVDSWWGFIIQKHSSSTGNGIGQKYSGGPGRFFKRNDFELYIQSCSAQTLSHLLGRELAVNTAPASQDDFTGPLLLVYILQLLSRGKYPLKISTANFDDWKEENVKTKYPNSCHIRHKKQKPRQTDECW